MPNLLITTMDNPFNPFTQFAEWYAFDIAHGYKTSEYLAALTLSSNELSEQDKDEAINAAVLEIFRLNLSGNRRIVEEDPNPDNEEQSSYSESNESINVDS